MPRNVWQLTLEGEEIKQFSSVIGAAKATNTPPSSLFAALNGALQKANGFKWRYAEIELNNKTKICKTCNIEKQIVHFRKAMKGLDGYSLHCKECTHSHEQALEESAKSRKEHDDKKERCCKKCGTWKPFDGFHNDVKGKHGLMSKCKVCVRQYNSSWTKNKCKTDTGFRILCNLRRRMTIEIQKLKAREADSSKCDSSLTLIGTNIETLKQHIERKFQEGMTWDNYGKWHMDHIRPCASFDFSIAEEQHKCFHYTYLQPLWAADNLRKGAKYTHPDKDI